MGILGGFIVQKAIEDIVYNKDIYPRDKIDQSKVEEYKNYIGVLPEIEINQNNELIDGVHRFFAHKQAGQKFIRVSDDIIKTKNDLDAKLKSIEKNATHGLPLNPKEKRNLVIEYYQAHLEQGNGFTPERLQQTFSIPSSTFSDWTKNLNEEYESKRLENILDLHLQCHTQQQIAEYIGLPRGTIANKIIEIDEKCNDLLKNPDSELPTKFGFLAEKTLDCSFEPKLYNLWNTTTNNNEYKHFGNFPIEFMQNLLYYYTEPFDVVYDPFAGGGSTIDACKKMLRKYYASDLHPIELRDDIKQWDVHNGLPSDLPRPDFVFLDPPYWKQAENKYSESKKDLSNISLEEFYQYLESFIRELRKKMNGGHIAFVISATQKEKRVDHAFDIYEIFKKLKYDLVERIILPYSTQQYNGTQVKKTKENKTMLNLYRDLMIFKK